MLRYAPFIINTFDINYFFLTLKNRANFANFELITKVTRKIMDSLYPTCLKNTMYILLFNRRKCEMSLLNSSKSKCMYLYCVFSPQVRSLQGTQNAARRILDSMTMISGTVSDVSSAPAASLARWAADQVAPTYWRPNADIVNCHHCNKR